MVQASDELVSRGRRSAATSESLTKRERRSSFGSPPAAGCGRMTPFGARAQPELRASFPIAARLQAWNNIAMSEGIHSSARQLPRSALSGLSSFAFLIAVCSYPVSLVPWPVMFVLDPSRTPMTCCSGPGFALNATGPLIGLVCILFAIARWLAGVETSQRLQSVFCSQRLGCRVRVFSVPRTFLSPWCWRLEWARCKDLAGQATCLSTSLTSWRCCFFSLALFALSFCTYRRETAWQSRFASGTLICLSPARSLIKRFDRQQK